MNIISKCAVGLAPYLPDPKNFTYYAEPGKIKEYLSCGVPVITTGVAEISADLERSRVGFVIKYCRRDLIRCILNFFMNDELLETYKKNAINFILQYNADRIFKNAFKKVFQYLKNC